MSDARWPNLFVAGVAKAGTTSLARWLGAHPDVFMSRVKEPHFFSRYRPPLFETVHDEGAYLALFEDGRHARYRGEASPSYFWHSEAAARIRRASPDARVVISLRDPVERAYSHYWTCVRYGIEDRTFADAVREQLAAPLPPEDAPRGYVERGFYVAPVARFQREFGDALHVVFFEELTAAPRATLVRLLDALDLDAAPTVEPELSPANPFALPRTQGAANVLASARARRAARAVVPLRFREPVESLLLRRGPKPALDGETRLLLEHAYAAEAQQLAELLGRPLPWCAS